MTLQFNIIAFCSVHIFICQCTTDYVTRAIMRLIYRIAWCLAGWAGKNTGPAAATPKRERNLKNGRLLNKLRHLNDFNKLN